MKIAVSCTYEATASTKHAMKVTTQSEGSTDGEGAFQFEAKYYEDKTFKKATTDTIVAGRTVYLGIKERYHIRLIS